MDDETTTEDVIIQEIPIYLSRTLLDNLYIYQYPNKKIDSNLNDAEVLNCCIKPVNQEVKIDYALNTESVHYDRHKGTSYATAADGTDQRNVFGSVIPQKSQQKVSYRSGLMDKQTYVSAKPLDNVDKYIVGLLQDSEIHATSIKSILQMRPTFTYFDKSDVRKKVEEKSQQDDLDDDEAPQQITVRFARKENDRIRKAREKSYTYLKQKSADEPWCQAMWYPKSSLEAGTERQKLFSTTNQLLENCVSLETDEYLNTLLSPERTDISIESLLPTKVVCMNNLKKMPLSDQIQNILKDSRVVTFNKLFDLLSDKSMTTEKVLRTLPSIGVLVQGNWVIQSELLYPVNTFSNINGVSSELMCRARDYMLYKFSKNEVIDRSTIGMIVQIPPEEINEILQSIGCLDKGINRWKLLLPPDNNFEIKYPEINQRQETYWRAKEETFQAMEAEKFSKRTRKRSIRENKITEKT